MIRYITRHGQVSAAADYIGGDYTYPSGDMPLSPLGREQAALLGKRLRAMGFKGRILASPFHRTLETACIIAAEVDGTVTPYGPIHEIVRSEKFLAAYRGQTIEDIRQKYPRIDPDATLEYPWWPSALETEEDVLERVQRGVERAEALYPDEVILYVGHGASTNALMKAYAIPRQQPGFPYNCFLSSADPQDEHYKKVYCDLSHLPYHKTTNNFATREERDLANIHAAWPHDIELPEGIKDSKGPILLHIGDTFSYHYPYFFKLIDTLKPDIILHTGDMSDETKVGRLVGTYHEYLTKVSVLVERLRQSGARLIFVPGNHDIAPELARMAPEAEIYPRNTKLKIDGQICRIGHQVAKMTFDTPWAFYGHGPTGDNWKPQDNREGQPCRFNATYGSFICCLSEGKFFHLPFPWKQK